MVTLSIDTSEQHCSVALVRGEGVLAARSDHIGRGHAEHLLPLIDEVLGKCHCTYADIGRIGVVTGPGTFTGLRIGLSVARGLALTLDVPCVGVSGLHALAAAAGETLDHQTCSFVHAVITGRGGQAFHQAFERIGAADLKPVSEPRNMDVVDIEAAIAECPGPVVGSGLSLLMPFMQQSEYHSYCVDAHVDPVIAAKLADQLPPDDHPPEPLYLRAADAKKKAPLIAIAKEADA